MDNSIKKPSIILVAPRFPFPIVKGDQVVALHRLRQLSRFYNIHFISINDRESTSEDLSKVSEIASSVHILYKSKARRYLDMSISLISNTVPLEVAYFRSSKTKSCIENIIKKNEIQHIHFITFRTLRLKELSSFKLPVVMDFIDSFKLNFTNSIPFLSGWKKKLYQIELKRVTELENDVAELMDYGIVVSERDKEAIGSNKVHVVPNGVDIEDFHPIDLKKGKKKRIIFTGNMHYEPNKQAYNWFMQSVWPFLAESDITFVVAGKSSQNLERPSSDKNSDRLILKGYVESMNEELNLADIAIAPMQSGSGIQNKILEAMAAGLPVVATPFGASPIGADETDGLFTRSDPEEFARTIAELCANRDKLGELGKSARRFVIEHYAWEETGNKIHSLNKKYINTET